MTDPFSGPELVAEKYLRVPDCDDDRVNHRTRELFHTRELVNPRHLAAQAEVYGTGVKWEGARRVKALQEGDWVGGWYPAITLQIGADGTRTELPYEEARENEKRDRPRRYPAGVHARWTRLGDGTHRISVWGGDDHYLAREGLSERRARNLWARLNDFVTVKTLHRLGFRYGD